MHLDALVPCSSALTYINIWIFARLVLQLQVSLLQEISLSCFQIKISWKVQKTKNYTQIFNEYV